jgi:hypothetical protein
VCVCALIYILKEERERKKTIRLERVIEYNSLDQNRVVIIIFPGNTFYFFLDTIKINLPSDFSFRRGYSFSCCDCTEVNLID